MPVGCDGEGSVVGFVENAEVGRNLYCASTTD